MNNWLYENKIIESINDMPENTFGFIYKITHLSSGTSYLGKKSLYHNVKRKLTKKELALITGPGRKPTTEIIKKESDWKTYFGSEETIKKLIKEGKQDEFSREILLFVKNKKLLTYFESKYLFTYEVLEHPDKWFNNNIQGHFYSKDFL